MTTLGAAAASADAARVVRQRVGVLPGPCMPTDRPHKHQENGPVGRFGIDTLAIRGPVDAAAMTMLPRQRFRREVDRETGQVHDVPTSAEVELASGHRVRVDTWRGRPEVHAELSVPRLLRGDNRLPASPAEVYDIVQRLHLELGTMLPWRCSPEELHVTRIDLARDFEMVDGAPHLLAALMDVPGLRCSSHAFAAAGGGGIQTLVREATRWRGRMYDRGSHYANKARAARGGERSSLRALAISDQGVVRFELQLRRDEAQRRGIKRVRDLLEVPLAALAQRYFDERCGFGRVVAGAAWKLQAAAEALRARQKYKSITAIAGQLALDAYGLAPGANARTATEYRRQAARLGLTPADVLRPDHEPVQFEFQLGRVVPAHDALRARSA